MDPNQQLSQEELIQTTLISAFVESMGPSGGLFGVQSIQNTAMNETNLFPYIGVEIRRVGEPVQATNFIESWILFSIVLSCRSTTLMQDAYRQRQALLDDGQGNGIKPILRNIMFTKFGGLIGGADILPVEYVSSTQTGTGNTPTEFIAEAIIQFKTYQRINV